MPLASDISTGRADPDFPWLSEDQWFSFPKAKTTSSRSVVCTGGNLSPGMLLSAYRQGSFPWFNDDDPIVWHSPDPRFILEPRELHVC